MAELVMDSKLKKQYRETMRRLDDDIREIEEIHEEMDQMLYDVEKRIQRLRRSKRV